MASASSAVVSIFALIIGAYLYLYFHEYVHWLAGELFSGNPDVLYGYWHRLPYPYAVKFKSIEHMSSWEIRIAGISPHILWTNVTVSYIGNPLSMISTNLLITINRISESITSTPFLTLVFVTASAGAGVGVSPSDLVATLRPEDFREYAGYELSKLQWGRVLIGHSYLDDID
jgi:hypothetical protein